MTIFESEIKQKKDIDVKSSKKSKFQTKTTGTDIEINMIKLNTALYRSDHINLDIRGIEIRRGCEGISKII